jgi:hypothetical protein
MIYYVALPLVHVDGGLASGEAVECPYAAAAIRHAQALACSEAIAGAVAFLRRGSPDLGEFEDAVILKTLGEVPVGPRADSCAAANSPSVRSPDQRRLEVARSHASSAGIRSPDRAQEIKRCDGGTSSRG